MTQNARSAAQNQPDARKCRNSTSVAPAGAGRASGGTPLRVRLTAVRFAALLDAAGLLTARDCGDVRLLARLSALPPLPDGGALVPIADLLCYAAAVAELMAWCRGERRWVANETGRPGPGDAQRAWEREIVAAGPVAGLEEKR